MKRSTQELIVFLLLIAAGATSRVVFRELPNFAPIAAMALFAGYYFRAVWLAALVPLAALSISDWFIGGYDWKVMAAVYAMLTLPVSLRPLVRRFLKIEQYKVTSVLASLAGLVTCSLGSSLLFFVVTNFACWYEYYPRDWSGMARCYAAAIPFLKYTLLGDLFYACVLFGGHALAVNLSWRLANASELAPTR